MKWLKNLFKTKETEESFEKKIVNELEDLISKAKTQKINAEQAKENLRIILLKIETNSKEKEAVKEKAKKKEKVKEGNRRKKVNKFMGKNSVTFIIPSVGRPALMKTITSLQEQTIKNWNAIIIYDSVPKSSRVINEDFDERVKIINLEKKLGIKKAAEHIHGNAGNVRNVGLNEVETEWVAFVDDDDYLLPTYLQTLEEESENCNLFIFRMNSPQNLIIPNGNNIAPCNVGISFAVKNEFIDKHDIKFRQGDQEDGGFVLKCIAHRAIYKISKDVLYIAN